jgi:DNA modification methylase
MRNKIYNENCLTGLKKLPENSIDCCITSPPYFGLRDYGTAEQIGLEETPELFVAAMVEVFTEVKRVLKNDGTLWLNLGDSYAANRSYQVPHEIRGSKMAADAGGVNGRGMKSSDYGLKAKDLIGIPWMVAFALRSSGWYLRQDIIWNKPNPMPESVTDRCTKSHEYIFLMSKSAKYYYDNDSIKTDATYSSIQRTNQDLENQKGSDRVPGKTNGNMKAISTFGNRNGQLNKLHSGNEYFPLEKANKRSVWTVTTKPFSEAHFATFPQDLIVDMVKAGCPEDGIILDPFMGAGTTAVVARKLNRNYVGFELNTAYIKIAENRLRNELGMYL